MDSADPTSVRPAAAGTTTWLTHAAPYLVVALWTALFIARALSGHASLESGAFDLGAFDRAIHDLPRSGRGYVPFLGASIFSEDFSPILYLLAPLHALWPSPILLVVLQPLVLGAAALVFFHVARRIGAGAGPALALMIVFLLARRTHSAFAGYFHPESFQVALTFALVWCSTRTWAAYAAVVFFLLTTHETASLSAGAFGLFLAAFGPADLRRRGLLTAAVAAAWFVYATVLVVPDSRATDRLPPTSTLISRPAEDATLTTGPGDIAGRILSGSSAATIGELLLTAGLWPLAGGVWLLPAVPGLLVNLAAPPGSLQAAIISHYAAQVLPWLFVSAAAGFVWVHRRVPALAQTWLGLLLIVTVADNPAIPRLPHVMPDTVAANVRAQIDAVGRTAAPGAIVLSQANLVPHVPYTLPVFVAGRGPQPPRPPDLVLLTRIGDLWPLTRDDVGALIDEYRRDPRYRLTVTGPLYAFTRQP